jgi:enoyl-CoA hydratase/carnithine racemase
MQFETLDIDVSGPIGRLTLNRPQRLNALSSTMLRELVDAARWFDTQSDIRVVIVRGAGRAFCAGADLKDASRNDPDESWLARRAAAQAGLRMIEAIERMNAITIASVHGHAIGGAVLLMAACDLRVVAEDASFSIPEVELGIPLTWGGIPRLVREIGPAMTKELVLTCRTFTPSEAKAMRFVNAVVPAMKLEQHVAELAASIAAMPAVPASITKQHVNAVAQMLAGSASYADPDLLLSAYASPESSLARQAYAQRHLKAKPRD